MDFPTRDNLVSRGESLDRRIHYLSDWFGRAPILAAIGDATHLRQVNHGWTKFLGWSTSEILSLQWTSIIHPHDMDQTIEACLKNRLPMANYPNRYLNRQGHYVWVRWYMDFPTDDGFFYSCGIPILEETDELREIARRRAEVFEATHG